MEILQKMLTRLIFPKLSSIYVLCLSLGFVTPLFAGTVSFPNCTITQPSTNSLQQSLVAEGTGLDYTLASAPVTGPVTVILPPGATPVTAFLYVEYNNGSQVAPNPVAITFNGSSTPTGTSLGAVTYTGYINTFYNIRYPIDPSTLTGGGASGSQTAYAINTSANTDICKGLGLLVLYTDPAQQTTNAVALADGENAWHLEDNGVAVFGTAPPDTQLDWSCLGLNCTSSNVHFSVLGGAGFCLSTTDEFIDQIESWGSGSQSAIGFPALWSGAPGALNCPNGTGPNELVRNYYPPASILGGATHLEWGLSLGVSPLKSDFWQQALVAQYQCDPATLCGVTVNFSPGTFTGPPPGWIIGSDPPFQSSWAQGNTGISIVGATDEENQLLNTQVNSGPGTLTVSMCLSVNPTDVNGITWDVDNTTGKGYGLNFFDNGVANNGSTATFYVYGSGGATVASQQVTTLGPGNPLTSCPTWVQLVIASGNQFILSLANSQAALASATPVTFTDTSGSNYTSGMMGLQIFNLANGTFSSFQWAGAGCAVPTPTLTVTPTMTETTTSTVTSTPTQTGTPAPPIVSISKYCPADPPTTYTTIATTYGPLAPGTGNCGFPGGTYDPNNYAALISTDYQNGLACGACAALQDASSGGAVTVMVVDSCPSCNTAHQLDLGPSAWNTLTNNAMPGVANITWNFMPCPLSLLSNDPSGNIEYEWKNGCLITYDPIQFLDALIPITNVSFSTTSNGTYTPLVLGSSGVGGNEYWGTSNGSLNGTTGPFYFDVTDATGESVTLGPISLAACGVTYSANNQFLGCAVTTTFTFTLTPTDSATPTVTLTATNSTTPTVTSTITSTVTVTETPTITQTITDSATPTVTSTATSTATVTETPTVTQTFTDSATPTVTLTATDSTTPTVTSTITSTVTETETPTITLTITDSATPTVTSTATSTATVTETPTVTQTFTDSATPTVTLTATNSATPTVTSTITSTATVTATPTITLTATDSATPTVTATITSTATVTETPTITSTYTQTQTSTQTSTATPTLTQTITFTNTNTASSTATPTMTLTATVTPTSTTTPTPTTSATPTVTFTWTLTSSVTPTNTQTLTPTRSLTPTPSPTPSASWTQTFTPSPTSTQTLVPTQSFSPTPTPGTGGRVCSPPYPNPCDGTKPVCFNVQANGNCTIYYDVFTLAFKHIAAYSTRATGNMVLSWDLRDKSGKPCSSGLFYVRVTVKPDFGTKTSQIIKILLVR